MKIQRFNENKEEPNFYYYIEVYYSPWESVIIEGEDDEYNTNFDPQDLEDVVRFYLEYKEDYPNYKDVRIEKVTKEDISNTEEVKSIIKKLELENNSEKYNL